MAFRECAPGSPSGAGGRNLITEQSVIVPEQILECDRFYWKRQLKPRTDVPEDWRRVDMSRELRPLFDDLESVEMFSVLSITADITIPVGLLRRTRLFIDDGNPLRDISDTLFWLPLNFIAARLT